MPNNFLPTQLNRPPERKANFPSSDKVTAPMPQTQPSDEGFIEFLKNKFSAVQEQGIPMTSEKVTSTAIPSESLLKTARLDVIRRQLKRKEGMPLDRYESLNLAPEEQSSLTQQGEYLAGIKSIDGQRRIAISGEPISAYKKLEQYPVSVAQTPITVGPITLAAGEWAGLFGITVATGGAAIATLPFVYQSLISNAFSRNINKLSVQTNTPVTAQTRKAVAEYLARQVKPSFANAAKSIKELFKPTAQGKFIPTPQATAKADAYTQSIIKRILPEFSMTRTNEVIAGIQSGKYADIVPPSAQAVQGVVGELKPTIILATTKTVNIADEISTKTAELVGANAIESSFLKQEIRDLKIAQTQGKTTYQMTDKSPEGYNQVEVGGKKYFVRKDIPTSQVPQEIAKQAPSVSAQPTTEVTAPVGEVVRGFKQFIPAMETARNITKQYPTEDIRVFGSLQTFKRTPLSERQARSLLGVTKARPDLDIVVLNSEIESFIKTRENQINFQEVNVNQYIKDIPEGYDSLFNIEGDTIFRAGTNYYKFTPSGLQWINNPELIKSLKEATPIKEVITSFESQAIPKPTQPPTTAPVAAIQAPEAVSEGITPTEATKQVNTIQEQGAKAPKSVKPADAKYAHIEKAAPDGAKPPKPPRARPPREGISPESKPLDIFKNILDKQLEGESLSEATMRLYGGAVRKTNRVSGNIVQRINDQLKALGIGKIKRGQLIPQEKDIPVLRELYSALHNPSKVASGEIAVPAGFEAVYNELRVLADWDTASRLDFDPNAAILADWFFRGWKPPEGKFTGAPGRGGLVTEPKALRTPRVNASFEEMLELGYEPLFWNPAHQWQYRHNLGEVYREQMELVDFLKKRGSGFILPDSGGPMREGWKIPRIGPAFEGKPYIPRNPDGSFVPDADGNPMIVYTRRWAVPNKTATLLEGMFGRRPELTLGVGEKEIDVTTILDAAAFAPKRAKLFVSFFQQMDFLNRAGSSSWAKALDDVLHGKPIDAAIAVLRYPKTALDILHANFSPGKRLSLSEQLNDTKPLVKGRPGVHFKGISEAGINTVDVTLMADEMDKLIRLVAKESGVWSKFKGVGDSIVELESAMRRGLFQGTYPAAVITDIKNNIAVMMARQHPRATDEQINGYIAQEANMKYSLLSVEQSIVHKTWIREILRRVVFSFNESEALIRQTTRMFHGPNKAYWAKQNAGVLLFLAVVANIIHFASTGEPLPKERYIPVAEDNWGPLPFGYNPQFISPTLPFKGRGGAEVTADLMGQMDTVWRLLNPSAFMTARLSVPVRAGINQATGTDFYGASMDSPAQRAAYLAYDLFAPIGIGGIGTELLRQNIPGAEDVLPEGESRLGLTGLAVQATGLNVRAEGTREILDRKARERGYLKADGTPVMNWDELEGYQRAELNKDKSLIAELALRRETSLRRDAPGAAGYAEKEALKQERIDRGEVMVGELEQGRIEASVFSKEVTKLKAEISNKRAQVDDDFQLYQDTLDLPQDPNKRALVEYYSIYDKAKLESGIIDWDAVEQWEAGYRQYWTDEQEAYVDRNVGITEWGPKMQVFIDTQKTLQESGYWDIKEPNQYDKRQQLRRAMPEVDAILQKWYGYKPLESFTLPTSRKDPFGNPRADIFGGSSGIKRPVFK